MTVKIVLNDKPTGKVADAELHFSARPLHGLKLIGFAIWETKGKRTVTFPARAYQVNRERRSFALLRPVCDLTAYEELRALILDAYDAEIAIAKAEGR